MKVMRNVAALGALLVACSWSSAQLVVGTTSSISTSSNGGVPVAQAYYIDFTQNPVRATPLWGTNAALNIKVNGVAGDDASRTLYTVDSARLSRWAYGSQPTSPTLISGLYRYRASDQFVAATGFDDLSWVNGKLYGWTQFGSTVFGRGIYEIPTSINGSFVNPTTGVTTLGIFTSPQWIDTTGTYSFGGMTWSAALGKFYAVNSSATPALGRGIYLIDAFGATANAAPVKLADLPAGAPTTIDGLALGDNGILYLTVKPAASATVSIYTYDTVANAYDPVPFSLTYASVTEASRSTGAAWLPAAIPEPSAVALLSVAGLALGRRARRA